MTAYYNEIDSSAATILRELIVRNVIAPGVVDERSIVDVQPGDLAGFTQCHFFAGGGLWSVAARIAGWPDDRPLWTGSCPCQPFSQAGKRAGTDDPRHLWPHFYRLIRACRPPVVMGEQVAGAAGYGWFDGVRADLAGEDYAARAVDIPACAVDAPHQRNRLYWLAVADAVGERRAEAIGESRDDFATARQEPDDRPERSHGADCIQRDAESELRRIGPDDAQDREIGADHHNVVQPDADRQGQLQCEGIIADERRWPLHRHDATPNGSWWADAGWIVSPLDGKARRAKPGIPFLVDGLPGRVDLWRVGGNAISPILAAEVVAAARESLDQ